jgi:hypothetical protein
VKKPRKFQTPLNMVSEVYFLLVLLFLCMQIDQTLRSLISL